MATKSRSGTSSDPQRLPLSSSKNWSNQPLSLRYSQRQARQDSGGGGFEFLYSYLKLPTASAGDSAAKKAFQWLVPVLSAVSSNARTEY